MSTAELLLFKEGRAPYELIRAVRVRGKQSEFVDTKVSKILTYIVHNEQRCSHASLVTKEHFRNTIRNTDGVQVELRRFPARVEHDKQLPLLLSAFMQRLIICRHESYTHPETFSIEDTSRWMQGSQRTHPKITRISNEQHCAFGSSPKL